MVRFEHVGLRYGLGPEVLRDLTFRIDPHSFQFLTGPSGAGKTTLLRLLFLSLRPTRGLATIFGHDIGTLSKDALSTLRRRIGIVMRAGRPLAPIADKLKQVIEEVAPTLWAQRSGVRGARPG